MSRIEVKESPTLAISSPGYIISVCRYPTAYPFVSLTIENNCVISTTFFLPGSQGVLVALK
nr:MAG TPA: hypothetical protein [Caudoviricetes sp.]